MVTDEFTLEEKKGLLAELKRARFSGALRVKFNDRDVTYKSDAEMARAISALEADIVRSSGVRRSGVLLTSFSDGA
ncbi:conserved hypothetical protein [Roseibium sp. TrichSKD4]|uniref:phage head-tail joining protein n=1 Tax=Roseibium sp. TrichSKD4 TaxID=744980 RepID=UPI0001E56CCF|nr:hypothetical protein [Roseibium sp. TrichSKD4]EFO32122.1 conserved hypothetical protein [Roseibium sp. TrichSKD4]